MNILLFGKEGQLGWELRRTCQTLGKMSAFGISDFDLTDFDHIRKVFKEVQPQVVLNAAAYTQVDLAEKEKDLAQILNAEVCKVLANESKKCGSFLVHFSTDYVFDGKKDIPYEESDATSPLSHYGSSKRDGDFWIQNIWEKHMIFRISWIYSHRGKNFVKTILKLAQEKEELRIVQDQIGTPTSARFVAEATAQVLAQRNFDKNPGLYNLVPDGNTNWFEFTQRILSHDLVKKRSNIKCTRVFPISTEEFPTPARRPKNSRLNNNKFKKTFGLNLTPWEESLSLALEELLLS